MLRGSLWRYAAGISAAVALFLLLALAGESLEQFLPTMHPAGLRLVTEFFAAAIALMVVSASWHTFDQRADQSGGVLIAGFLVVGLCTLMQLLAYPGMPATFTDRDENHVAFFAVANRTAELGVVAAFGLGWRLPLTRLKAALTGLLGALALACIGAYGLELLPVAVTEGGLTLFGLGSKTILGLLGILLAGALLHRALRTESTQPLLLSLASGTLALGGLLSTASPRPSALQDGAGHVFKLVAYLLLYRAAYLSALLAPYRALSASKEQERDSQERLQSLGANLPNIVLYQLATARDGELRFAEVSDSIERVCGLTATAVQADAALWLAQVVPEDAQRLASAARRSSESLQPLEELVRLKVADGRERIMRVVSAPRHPGDGGVVWDGFVLDATDQTEEAAARQVAEVQLRDAQRMESIGTLASGIAHDFNNVLASMLGNTAMVLEDARREGRIDVVTTLEQVQSEGRRGRHLVRQILTFSRKHAVEMRPHVLAGLVDENVALLRATLPAGVHLDVHVRDRAIRALVDQLQVGQVIVNLVANAWSAVAECAERQGRIEVGLDSLRLTGETAKASNVLPGVYAHLWVEDNGCGMEEATRRRAFEPFFTTKPVGEATGLGLAVTHGIVESHRGAIQVTSAVGVGTKVSIYLPALVRIDADELCAPVSPAREVDEVPAIVGNGRGERVLYIDDVEIMALMVERLLTRANYRVRIATTADDGLRMFRAGPDEFDVLVTDYNMPLKTGLDVIREVREVRPDIPVVLTSGFVTDALRRQAAVEGVNRVLEKQNTFEELGKSLQEALDGATRRLPC